MVSEFSIFYCNKFKIKFIQNSKRGKIYILLIYAIIPPVFIAGEILFWAYFNISFALAQHSQDKCESVYLFDTNIPESLRTGDWVPYRDTDTIFWYILE